MENNKLELIKLEIEKLKNKDFKFVFFVIDTQGNSSGSLAYIYNTAYTLHEMGYNVEMAYDAEIDEETGEDDFVGVGDWMGEKFANLPHINMVKNGIEASVSDFFIIPEIYAEIMKQTKINNVTCKRIVLSQNVDLISEFIAPGMGWGDYGIVDVITTTKKQASLINEMFPYTRINVVEPFINPVFRPKKNGLKDLRITLLTKDIRHVNKIVKEFIWKYPIYRWVAFEVVRGLSQEEVAEKVRDSAFSVWVDNETDFGYSLLEAIESDNLVIAKIPNSIPEVFLDEEGQLINCALWVNDMNDIHRTMASAIKWWMEDVEIPELEEGRKLVAGKFKKEDFKANVKKVYEHYVDSRIKEIESLVNNLNKEEK